MPTDNRLFDDLSRIAAGAFSTAAGIRDEVEQKLRDQVERIVTRLDLVRRDEFEAVKAMAALARSEQEALAARLALLEAQPAKPKASRGKAEPPQA